MSTMSNVWIGAAALVLSGLAGGGLGWWLGHHAHLAGRPPEAPFIDPDRQRLIDNAAYRWACTQGRPELAQLAAHKLRLLDALHVARGVTSSPRRRRSWWR